MFKKLLTVGALATALIGGIGTASAYGTEYNCEGRKIRDQDPGGGNSMWVVHPTRIFSSKFSKFGSTWYIKGPILSCNNGKYAAYYEGQWN